MSFLKTKTYKVLSIIEICVLVVIIALNLISSFAKLGNTLNVTFFVIILIGALYVIGVSITSIIFLAKEKRKEEKAEKNKESK